MATPLTANTALATDQLNTALYQLAADAPPDIVSAIYILNLLGYTTPAADLQTALNDLRTATANAQAAVASGTLG
jgi:hypothetical protein